MLVGCPLQGSGSAYPQSCVAEEGSYENSFAREIGCCEQPSDNVAKERARRGRKVEAAVGTTYRWNTAAALLHTAQRFSSMQIMLALLLGSIPLLAKAQSTTELEISVKSVSRTIEDEPKETHVVIIEIELT